LNVSLTAQLRRAIKTSGVSVYRIAKDSRIPWAVVYRFAAGKRQIKLDTADKLAAYFGMKLTAPKLVSPK
jgi:plasmid maintenance system antidote protein VapI